MNEQDKKRFDKCLQLTIRAIEDDCARVPLGRHPRFWEVTEVKPAVFWLTEAAVLVAVILLCLVYN